MHGNRPVPSSEAPVALLPSVAAELPDRASQPGASGGPPVVLTLVEQLADLRSNEVSYKFTIANDAMVPIQLRSTTPLVPRGVRVLEVIDPSQEADGVRIASLCRDLSEILNTHIDEHIEVLRVKRRELTRQIDRSYAVPVMVGTNDVFQYLFQILRSFLNALLIDLKWTSRSESQRKPSTSKAFYIDLHNAQDARAARDEWLTSDDALAETSKRMYETKLRQLEAMQNTSRAQPGHTQPTLIQPNSSFSQTYVLRFPRSTFSARKYSLAVQCYYSYARQAEEFTGSAEASLQISPNALVLTIIAVLSSILGVLLRMPSDESVRNSMSAFTKGDATQFLITGAAITPMILAGVFFNAFEFTDFGTRFKMGVGWRSALVIGVLCGLTSDRILSAVKAFAGA